MNINVIGSGTWGVIVSTYLSNNGHNVIVYHRNSQRSKKLIKFHKHPNLPGHIIPARIKFTSNFKKFNF